MPPLRDQSECVDSLSDVLRDDFEIRHPELTAHGLIHALLTWCWANRTDTVPSIGDVDKVTHWTGAQRIAPALVQSGALRPDGQRYFCPLAVTEAPEYVRKHWRRHLGTEKWQAMLSRATGTSLREQYKMPVPEPVGPKFETVDLFGNPMPVKRQRKRQRRASPKQQEVTTEWHQMYLRRYGQRYAWRPRDHKHIHEALKQNGYDDVVRSMRAFLASTSPFNRGHDLGKWYTNLNQWLAEGRAKIEHEHNDDDALPG